MVVRETDAGDLGVGHAHRRPEACASTKNRIVGAVCEARGMPERPEVPDHRIRRLDEILSGFPGCSLDSAWVGVRWRVGTATVAHVFGGEDQRFRITFRAEPDEVMALQHLGEPYFKAGWGGNVVGLILDDETDWAELTELLTDSYCLVAPARQARAVSRPAREQPE